jgi:hypothetical protein
MSLRLEVDHAGLLKTFIADNIDKRAEGFAGAVVQAVGIIG